MECHNNYKNLSESNFRLFEHIASVKYRRYIAKLCSKLRQQTSIDRICMCIIFNELQKFFLSNMPEWAIHYHQLGGARGDNVFDIESYRNQDVFFPRLTDYDLVQTQLVKIEESEYSHYDTFSIIRKSQQCSFIFLALHDIPTPNPRDIYNQNIKQFEKFCSSFLNNTTNIILEFHPEAKQYLIFSDKYYQYAVITKSYPKVYDQLTAREIEVLSLIAQNYKVNAAAKKLGISEKTVRNYLQIIRDKTFSSNTKEAIEKLSDFGLL